MDSNKNNHRHSSKVPPGGGKAELEEGPPSPSSSPYVLNYKRRYPPRAKVPGYSATVKTDEQPSGVHPHAMAPMQQEQHAEGSPKPAQHVEDSRIGSQQHAEGRIGTPQDDLQEVECHEVNSSTEVHFSAGMEWHGDLALQVSEQCNGQDVLKLKIVTGDACSGLVADDDSHSVSDDCGIEPIDSNRSDVSIERIDSNQFLAQAREYGCPASLAYDEFYDARDGLSDGDSFNEDESSLYNSKARNYLAKLGGVITTRLQQEVARRMRAEDSLMSYQAQWLEMAKRFSLIGLELPYSSFAGDSRKQPGCSSTDLSEIISQRLLVARLVGKAVASAVMKAAKEEEYETMVEAKNWEISRLRDKLQYYELVNEEMSLRNRETIECAQKRRRRRKKRQKVVYGCLAAVFSVGAVGLLCHKLIPWETVSAEKLKTWWYSNHTSEK